MKQHTINLLDYAEINPPTPPEATVIWLHGLGADGHDFLDIVPQLGLPQHLSLRFVFPHAPIRPVTLNAGYQMRAWFDIFGLDENSKQDEEGIRESQKAVHQLIQHEEAKGIPLSKIFLGGFSQGGAIALYAGLRYPEKLAGVIGLSTYLPLSFHHEKEMTAVNVSTPIFMGHGNMDPVVPLRFGQFSHQFLQKLGYAIDWHIYEMGHSVCPQEIRDISYWLQSHL